MKIFGIGLSKTGTSSLAKALDMLGYNIKDCLGVTQFTKDDITSIDSEALLNHDALTDTPIPSFYRELDKEYPGSKFILTIRDMDVWLKSCKKQFNQKSANKQSQAHNELFIDLYGTTIFDEDKFKKSYIDFVAKVESYFKGRPDDLLILDVTKGEGWAKLCPFLDKPIPEVPFPKANVTQIRWLNIHELAQNMRSSAIKMHQLSEDLTTNKSTPTNKIKKVLCSFFGINISHRIEKSVNNVQTRINKELGALDSNIPVISKSSHDDPIDIRSSWNHFWLVSCSEGNLLSEEGTIGYTINVALIEDGFPFLGIIYVPGLDSLYYAAIGQGAYKALGSNPPIKLDNHLDKPTDSPARHAQIAKQMTLGSTQNISYLLAQSIENKASSHILIENSKEWQTSAGHAILKTIGLTLLDQSTNTELKYNKKEWINADTSVDVH